MNSLIPDLVDTHAEQSPDLDAVFFLDQGLSYSELRDLSNKLANCLLSHNVSHGDRVGIYMDKCLEIPIAMYGIMKAGAIYVPLDPSAPATRTAEIIEDCGIRLLVSASNKKNRLQQIAESLSHQLSVVGLPCGDGFAFQTVSWEHVYGFTAQAPGIKILENDLAYIIYTSGSTGKPKGIMHTHYSGLSFARWAATEYQLSRNDRLSNHAPLHFDLSIFDYFAAAVAGASTVIIPEEYTKLPASYSQLIADTRITVLFTVPFALIQLLLRGVLAERDLSALRWIIFGGEPFPIKYLQQLIRQLPLTRFDNMYGPAEVNGCSHYTVHELNDSDTAIPIGRISQIAESLVVDDDFRPVESGEAGELLVRTPTMMQGYWARPDLNKNAFYNKEVEGEYKHVYYRTGDLVSLSDDGNMWFLGRKDRQVKVRGYRIELDEIEATLVAHDDVEEAAVYSVRKGDEPLQIQCAVMLKQGVSTTTEGIVAYLKNHLSWYAVPGALTLMDSFPRTSTGKIDRQTLSMEQSQ